MLREEHLKGMKTTPNDTITAIMDSTGREILGGLTKREYFSAMAMQGLLSKDIGYNREVVSVLAVGYADDLITALNGKEGQHG